MGTYVIYTEGGGEISFTTGNDEFFNVGNGELISDLNSQDNGLKKIDVKTSINKIDDIQDGNGTLIGTMQAQNFNKSVLELDKNNLIKAQNVYLENQQKILKATAQSSIRNTQAILNSQDANTSMLNSLKKAVEDTAYTNTLVQSQILEALQKIEEAITKKETTINATGGVNVSLDTSPIVESLNSMKENQVQTNEKIVEGIENQKLTNNKIVENLQKKNEHLDFLKDGNESLKDSNGNIIKPRDIEAKKNAEKYIEQKETNETDFEDVSDFIDDILGGVEDGMEAIGGADGFNLLENPIEAINRLLLEDYIINKDGEKK